jgi:hypothetical protein
MYSLNRRGSGGGRAGSLVELAGSMHDTIFPGNDQPASETISSE